MEFTFRYLWMELSFMSFILVRPHKLSGGEFRRTRSSQQQFVNMVKIGLLETNMTAVQLLYWEPELCISDAIKIWGHTKLLQNILRKEVFTQSLISSSLSRSKPCSRSLPKHVFCPKLFFLYLFFYFSYFWVIEFHSFIINHQTAEQRGPKLYHFVTIFTQSESL